MSHPALILIDHGSRQAAANALLEQLAGMVQQRLPQWIVGHAHMEMAQPDLARAMQDAIDRGASRFVVHPYFLAPGKHATQDIPRMARDLARQFGVAVETTEPLGLSEHLVNIVLERVEANGVRPQ